MDCIGGVLNDAVTDSKGGVYFKHERTVLRGAERHGDEAGRIVVTNAGTLVILDVGRDGQLSNQRKFADLDKVGLAEGQGAGGDGSCFDADGRLYISAANGIQVFDKDGKHLGDIPARRGMVSVAFSGPQRKTLYAVTAATVSGARKVWVDTIPLLATGPKGRSK